MPSRNIGLYSEEPGRGSSRPELAIRCVNRRDRQGVGVTEWTVSPRLYLPPREDLWFMFGLITQSKVKILYIWIFSR